MMKKLLIVESPAKAKTIGKYLGGDFTVKSSVGHVRDLPKKGGLAIRIEPVEGREREWTFTPTYEVSPDKKKVVAELKQAVKDSGEVYLASDPDREGEAIAWHLREVLSPVAAGKPFHRVTYNEITKSAVLKAVAAPRDIDMPLVDAQQARRILDRLVGYKVSPLLWRSVNCANSRTLSAGRVQSVALRLLVDRQREIDAFVPETYQLLGAEALKAGDGRTFVAKLARLDGERPDVRERDAAERLLRDLEGAELLVDDVRLQPKSRHALPPFTTSTLQQAASSVLGMSPGKTMRTAQALYEQGRITYMRTDSVNVSEQARAAAREFIERECGPEFYPERPNFFSAKAKAGVEAQEAHEAIRPTDVSLSPERAAEAGMDGADLKLYDLVWRRFVASQMADAKTTVKTLALSARRPERRADGVCPAGGGLAHEYGFTASATAVDFEGFLRVMKLSLRKKTKDGEDDEDSDEVAYLPDVAKGERLEVRKWLCDEKQTKGPTHYSEASLIKALEENGVGRPSTYAQTIETLKTREYAKTEKRKLVPLERGMLVCDWLVARMPAMFDVGYTAQMEGELDRVESGAETEGRMLSEFYAKFLGWLDAAKEPPPDPARFTSLFPLLDEVREWRAPKGEGKRAFDDREFVASLREQAEREPERLSEKQLRALASVAASYRDQIADADARLAALGWGDLLTRVRDAPPEGLVADCFAALDAAGAVEGSRFLSSIKKQFDQRRTLSGKQFAVLARTVMESAGDDARARLGESLAPFLPKRDDAGAPAQDPAPIAALLDMLSEVKAWREPVKRGKRVFDDRDFVDSLKGQFARRRSLTDRQVAALRKVVSSYRDQISDFEARAGALGVPTSSGRRRQKAE